MQKRRRLGVSKLLVENGIDLTQQKVCFLRCSYYIIVYRKLTHDYNAVFFAAEPELRRLTKNEIFYKAAARAVRDRFNNNTLLCAAVTLFYTSKMVSGLRGFLSGGFGYWRKKRRKNYPNATQYVSIYTFRRHFKLYTHRVLLAAWQKKNDVSLYR